MSKDASKTPVTDHFRRCEAELTAVIDRETERLLKQVKEDGRLLGFEREEAFVLDLARSRAIKAISEMEDRETREMIASVVYCVSDMYSAQLEAILIAAALALDPTVAKRHFKLRQSAPAS